MICTICHTSKADRETQTCEPCQRQRERAAALDGQQAAREVGELLIRTGYNDMSTSALTTSVGEGNRQATRRVPRGAKHGGRGPVIR